MFAVSKNLLKLDKRLLLSYRAVNRFSKIRLASTTATDNKPSRSNVLFVSSILLAVAGGYYIGNSGQQSKNEKLSSTLKLSGLKSPQYANPDQLMLAFQEISKIVGSDNVTKNNETKKDHSDTYWNSHHSKADELPYCVIYPKSTEEVSEIMKVCFKYRVPVVPFSGGTSLEGHFIPTRKGFCIDINNMNQILEFHEKDLDITVQPGIAWEDLNDYLADKGFMFGCDPGPNAEIGGMIGTSCSGTNAFKYGTMKENVINLTVVLPDGQIVKTKRRPRKSSAGYNLTNLFIGSEGTLGIVTEATLKVHIKPTTECIIVSSFENVEQAACTVEDIIKENNLQLNAVELMDENMMKFVNKSQQTNQVWMEKPTLFMKVSDFNEIKRVQKIAEKHKTLKFKSSNNEEDNFELWQARKVALWSTIDIGKSMDKNIQVWTTDVAVPISQLSAILKQTKENIDKSGLQATIVGHVGDGNFHTFLLYKPEQRAIAQEVVDTMVKDALKLQGTCTGEHGIGFGKRDYLLEEVGETAVDLMRKVKLSIDPLRIMNPDKVLKIDPNEDPHL